MADPTLPTVTAEDLVQDHQVESERLLAQLEGLSEEEALTQVYRQLALYLCGPCYQQWIENPAG